MILSGLPSCSQSSLSEIAGASASASACSSACVCGSTGSGISNSPPSSAEISGSPCISCTLGGSMGTLGRQRWLRASRSGFSPKVPPGPTSICWLCATGIPCTGCSASGIAGAAGWAGGAKLCAAFPASVTVLRGPATISLKFGTMRGGSCCTGCWIGFGCAGASARRLCTGSGPRSTSILNAVRRAASAASRSLRAARRSSFCRCSSSLRRTASSRRSRVSVICSLPLSMALRASCAR